MKEQLLSIDKFSNPTTIEGTDATATLFIRLILLRKGTIQSHPNMGVDLISKWRYCDEDQLPDLEKEIHDQISTYIPQLLVHQVRILYDRKYLIIQIALDTTTYVLGTEDFDTLTLLDILQS